MNKQRSSAGANRPQAVSTDFDDWETDPDYVRDMDEIDQRWGSRRTVGSINMNDLIDQVNREHKLIREKFQHPSQRLSSFTNEELSKTIREPVHGYEERMSKHSSTQEIRHKVYTSTSGSESVLPRGNSPDPRETLRPTIATKLDFIDHTRPTSTSPLKTSTFIASEPRIFGPGERTSRTESPSSPYKESSATKHIFKEEQSSALSSARNFDSVPHAFKSIQDNIDAFEKEFEDIKNKVSRKSDISKVIKKASNYETKSSSDSNFVSRNDDYSTGSRPTTSTKTTFKNRPDSTSPSTQSIKSEIPTTATSSSENFPKADIKGLSKRFESLFRESDDEFKRRTDARRKEFFDQIKSQVRETRKNLDGFDPIDDDTDYVKPKIYTRCETTKEEVVSKVVTENDKVVENETKRNVERSSSCHGSSDEDYGTDDPTGIKQKVQHLSKESTEHIRNKSPIDEIKFKIPVVEQEIKGAGLMARTLYDYQAAEDDELTFDVDDLITNIDKVSEEWYRGTIAKAGRQVTGLFPANYVKLLNDSSVY